MAKIDRAKGKRKRCALIVSEKGGVGKSTKARALIDQLRYENLIVAAYDADGSVGALVRVLGTRNEDGRISPEQDPVQGVGYYNVRAEEARNKLLDAIASGDELIVHDLAGGSLADLTRIVDGGEGLDGLLAAFEEHGYRLTIVHILSPDIGAVQSVASWLELVGDKVDHIAVRNCRWGRLEADFPFWYGFTDGKGVSKGGKTREKLLGLGGIEIDLPGIPIGTFAKIDAENMSFSAAAADAALTITERAHIAKFRRDYAAALDPARHLLGL